MVESVSMVESVDLSWGHFLPKGSLSLASHGGLPAGWCGKSQGCQRAHSVREKVGHHKEPTHIIARVNRTRRWQLSTYGSHFLEQACPYGHVTHEVAQGSTLSAQIM